MYELIIGMLIYLFSGFFMGGIITGILFPLDSIIDHKMIVFIIGNLWNFIIIILFVFLL